MLEAISICERLTGRPMNWSYAEGNRTGDHIWWISDVSKFQNHFPNWRQSYSVEDILAQIVDGLGHRLPQSTVKIGAGSD
jgi:CDP-paratose 2-epimerase